MQGLKKTAVKNIGLILSSLSTILMFFYQSIWWLLVVIVAVCYTIIYNVIENQKEDANFLKNIISKRANELKENILNASENTSIFYVNAPYKQLKEAPWLNLWNKYWDERHGRSELRFKDRFENSFNDAKKTSNIEKIEQCFYRLGDEVRHYYVSLSEFEREFKNLESRDEFKPWFFDVVEYYNDYIKKFDDDVRDLKIKFSKDVKINASSYKISELNK